MDIYLKLKIKEFQFLEIKYFLILLKCSDEDIHTVSVFKLPSVGKVYLDHRGELFSPGSSQMSLVILVDFPLLNQITV